MQTTGREVFDADLVGAMPAEPDGPGARKWRDALFPNLTRRGFEEPILAGRGLFGRYLLVSDPAGVRRVLVENAANYPKTALDLRFFTAIFGGGLLGSEGDVWRRHRRIMAPAFDPRSVAAYGPAITATARIFLERWDAFADGALIDMAQEMTSLTLQVISRTVFSSDSEDIIEQVRGMLGRGLETAAETSLLDLVPLVAEMRMRARERKMRVASALLDQGIARLVQEREANLGGAPADLLTRLVAAKDDDGGASLSAKEIRDEIVTIFMAGHETTANTLSWVWYLLAQRPAEGARLRVELDEVLGGRVPTTGDLPALRFTRQVIEESMRLYPAAPGLSTRRALEDDVICGHKVAKGTSVSILPWLIHRHRRLWDDPERFDPDRFGAERSAGRPRFAYLPFGAGPRVCIGQVLAMNEAILLLAALAQHYQPALAPGARVIPRANITLQMRGGLKMVLTRRS